MGVHPAGGLSEAGALGAVDRYLDRLRLAPEQRATLRAAAEAAHDPREAIEAVHAALAAGGPASGVAAYDSVAARLHLALGSDDPPVPGPMSTDVQGHARLVTTPRFNRSSMSPRRWFQTRGRTPGQTPGTSPGPVRAAAAK